MNTAVRDHDSAMAYAEQAQVARLRGDRDAAIALTRQAFDLERRAAAALQPHVGVEPTRSVLHRSAASLALECGQTREAEKLIAIGLSGDPPEDIAEELRDLLEQVHFHRHLELRGITLQPEEFQMSLAGGLVGFGIAQSDEFVDRVRDLETLLYRTAERQLRRPYRERGRRRDDLQRELELYISVPRAASLAVTFRVGSREQPSLPGLDFAQTVVDDVLDCMALLVEADNEALQRRINDEAYYRNFVGLARRIAPDGSRVRAVAFTALRPTGERSVVLSRPRQDLSAVEPPPPPSVVGEEASVVVRGTLKMSDSRDERRGLIQIVASDGTQVAVVVPPGMMRDIVRPLYEDEVVVRGRRAGNNIMLISIDRADDATPT
jgi:hypothetical protein